MIAINTPVDYSVLFAGIATGSAMSVKAIIWMAKGMKELIPQKGGSDANVGKVNGQRYLTGEEHEVRCAIASKPIHDSIIRIEATIINTSRERSQEVQMLYNAINKNHDDFVEQFGNMRERVAALETNFKRKD